MFNKNARRLLALALSLIMLFGFTACGDKEESSGKTSDASYSDELTFSNSGNDNYYSSVGQSSIYPSLEEEEEKPQLTNGTTLDIYPIIEQFIVYSGGNGGGHVELKIPEGYYQEINGCYFKADEYDDEGFNIIYNNEVIGEFAIYLSMVTEDYSKKYYSNGDTFKIKIGRPGYGSYSGAYQDYVNENIYKYGFLFPQVEKYYTVSDLGEYITSYTQLSAVELEKIKSFVINGELENCDVVDFKGCYEGKVKPFATAEPGSRCVVYITFYYVMYEGKMYELDGYKGVAVDEIIRKPDGSLSFELYNGWSLPSRGDTLEEMEETLSNDENYDFVKIG